MASTPSTARSLAAHKDAAFLALPGIIQWVLSLLAMYLPQIASQSIAVVAKFIAAHIQLPVAKWFLQLAQAVVDILEGGK